MNGITKGPFLGHFIWLLLGLLSLLQEARGKGGGAAGSPKGEAWQGAGQQDGRAPGRKLGLSTVSRDEKWVKAERTQRSEHSTTEEAPSHP